MCRGGQRKSLFCWVLRAGIADKATGRGRTGGLVGGQGVGWGATPSEAWRRKWYAPGTTDHKPWPGRDGEYFAWGGLSQWFSFFLF